MIEGFSLAFFLGMITSESPPLESELGMMRSWMHGRERSAYGWIRYHSDEVWGYLVILNSSFDIHSTFFAFT
jgi:hypothetical protein